MSKYIPELSNKNLVNKGIAIADLNTVPAVRKVPVDTSKLKEVKPINSFFSDLEFLPDEVKYFFEDNKELLKYSVIGGSFIMSLYVCSLIIDLVGHILFVAPIMELIGLGYSGWFVYKFLLFKEGRIELSYLMKNIKKSTLGIKE